MPRFTLSSYFIRKILWNCARYCFQCALAAMHCTKKKSTACYIYFYMLCLVFYPVLNLRFARTYEQLYVQYETTVFIMDLYIEMRCCELCCAGVCIFEYCIFNFCMQRGHSLHFLARQSFIFQRLMGR